MVSSLPQSPGTSFRKDFRQAWVCNRSDLVHILRFALYSVQTIKNVFLGLTALLLVFQLLSALVCGGYYSVDYHRWNAHSNWISFICWQLATQNMLLIGLALLPIYLVALGFLLLFYRNFHVWRKEGVSVGFVYNTSPKVQYLLLFPFVEVFVDSFGVSQVIVWIALLKQRSLILFHTNNNMPFVDYLRMADEQHINILSIAFMFHIVKENCPRLRLFLGRGNLREAGLRTHLMSAMSTTGLCSPAMSGTLRTLKLGFAPRRLPTVTNWLKILDMAR